MLQIDWKQNYITNISLNKWKQNIIIEITLLFLFYLRMELILLKFEIKNCYKKTNLIRIYFIFYGYYCYKM